MIVVALLFTSSQIQFQIFNFKSLFHVLVIIFFFFSCQRTKCHRNVSRPKFWQKRNAKTRRSIDRDETPFSNWKRFTDFLSLPSFTRSLYFKICIEWRLCQLKVSEREGERERMGERGSRWWWWRRREKRINEKRRFPREAQIFSAKNFQRFKFFFLGIKKFREPVFAARRTDWEKSGGGK